jgi:hypothetical protein
MADLTYLNDATVLHNLRERFVKWFIYVRWILNFNPIIFKNITLFILDLFWLILRNHQSI